MNYEIADYKNIVLILSKLYEKHKEIYLCIESYLRVFIMDLNNFNQTSKCPNPQNCNLDMNNINKLTELLNDYSIDSATFKKLFANSYKTIAILNPVIEEKDALIYFLKIFNGENIDKINRDIQIKYA